MSKTDFTFSEYLKVIAEKRIETPENIELLKTHTAPTNVMERNLKEYRNLKKVIERYNVSI
jgi:hypothetical protein